MQFHEFLELQKHKLYLYQNKCRINYLIYRIVQKYFSQLIIILKAYSAGYAEQSKIHGKGNFRNQKGWKFLIVLH